MQKKCIQNSFSHLKTNNIYQVKHTLLNFYLIKTCGKIATARGGGGLYFHYVCILGLFRARDPHFHPWISVSEHIIFTNYQIIRSGASLFHIFGGFCRSEDHRFQKFLSHGRLSPAQPERSAAPRVSSRGQSASRTRPGSSGTRIFTLKTDQARSGVPHFHARPGSSFRSPGPFFTLPRHIHVPTKIWGELPPVLPSIDFYMYFCAAWWLIALELLLIYTLIQK